MAAEFLCILVRIVKVLRTMNNAKLKGTDCTDMLPLQLMQKILMVLCPPVCRKLSLFFTVRPFTVRSFTAHHTFLSFALTAQPPSPEFRTMSLVAARHIFNIGLPSIPSFSQSLNKCSTLPLLWPMTHNPFVLQTPSKPLYPCSSYRRLNNSRRKTELLVGQ